jgi:hypothetical protein
MNTASRTTTAATSTLRASELRAHGADPGLTIFTYTAEPGSQSQEALSLLGRWAATLDEAGRADATDTPDAMASEVVRRAL